MPQPFSPPINWFAQQAGQTPARPFSDPVIGPQKTDPGFFAGLVGSAFSGLPELFGAPPTELAQQFRSEHPVAGFLSQGASMLVPYLGAERIAQLPSVAPKLASSVESVLGRFGLTAEAAPIRAGLTRELIVNAPVEASRLAVGTTLYPDNTDLWSDVAVNYALTGVLGGGIAGLLRKGDKVLSKAGQVVGEDIFLAPTQQLKAVLDDGAKIANAEPEDFIPQLRQKVFTETPGEAAASGKPYDYVIPLQGMSREDSKAINSLFVPEAKTTGKMTEEEALNIQAMTGATPEEVQALAEANKPTGLVKQTLNEGRSPKSLKSGEQQTLLEMLPETFKTPDDLAKNIQYPRRLTVTDKNGAREFAGIMSKPGWQKVGDRLSILQERNGQFIFSYQLAEGSGQAIGKGAGKTKVGSQFLVGKTLNPGLFDPQAKKLADLVTARWAKMGAAFAPRYDDVFNQAADVATRAMSVVDYHNMSRMTEPAWKQAMREKVGSQLAKEDGFLDKKFGYKNSKVISDIVDELYLSFKPTEFLQRQNPVYGRMFGLLRNAYRTGDELASKIMKGKQEWLPGTTQAMAARGKGVKYVAAFEGHEPYAVLVNKLTKPEVNLVKNLSGTDALNDEGLARLVKDGLLSKQGSEAVKAMRVLNEDVIAKVIMPVFKETGHEVDWLPNHLGVSHMPDGDFLYVVKNEQGQPKYLAFGKNGAQARKKAELVQQEAASAGLKWTTELGKPMHAAAQSEDVLTHLAKEVFTKVNHTPEEAEVIYRAMTKLSRAKSTAGRNPSIPISSGAFKTRTTVPTSFAQEEWDHGDMLNAIESHLKQLMHFSAVQSWKERYGSLAAEMLRTDSPKLYGDLIRKANQMLGIEGRITNTLNETLRPFLGSFAGSKPATKIAAGVNKYMAAANLFWFNPTFSVLNLLTPLQTVAPWIAHMRIASAEDLARTTYQQLTPVYNSKGMPTGMAAFTDPMKILGAAVQLMRKTPDDLIAFSKQADADGVLHTLNFEEWMGKSARANLTLRQAYKEDGIVGFIKTIADWPAEMSERFSRLTAFNAAYIVGKDYFNLEGDALYRFMRRGVEMTQYNYSVIDRSRMFTGPVGSMFGLFKNWQMHFLGNMLGYAGLIKNDAANPAAWAPLVWTVGAASALGGLGATPLAAMADGLANWSEEDKNSFLWTQNNFSPAVGDALYFGLPAFLGVSLQSSAAIPGTDVQNETSSLFSFAIAGRAKLLGKSIGDAWDIATATGENPFRDQKVTDTLFAAIMPRFMTKILASAEGDYVKSMSSGSPQVQNVSPISRLLNASGFNPIEVAEMQEAAKRAYKEQGARESLVNGLGRRYADAIQNQDSEEQERLIQRAIAAGVLDSMQRSAATRMRRDEGDILSRYSKEQQAPYREVLGPQG